MASKENSGGCGMESWYEKAQIELEEALTNGEIEGKQYREEMRNLDCEYDQYAREAAENTYNSFY
jgi:hypothetical protein